MKKIIVLLSLCVAAKAWGCELPASKIVDYEPSYKSAILEIAFQNPEQFFPGYAAIKQNPLVGAQFEEMTRKEMETGLDDALRIKKVLMHGNNIAGFVVFYKTKETSLELIKRQTESRGFPFNEEQVLAYMPHLKRTDAECEPFIKLESLAISKEFRGKGYGRILLRKAIEYIKELWPTIKRIQLDVNTSNEVARKLYESEGFVVCLDQPMARAGILHYQTIIQ